MTINELRSKTVEELNTALTEEFEGLFKLKFYRSEADERLTHLAKRFRKNIARIKTIIREKKG